MTPKNSLRVLNVAVVLQLGVLASSAQTNNYLFTGSQTNITLNRGTYAITAYGGAGAYGPNFGGAGLGAEMSAEFFFSGPTTLTLLVGGGGGAGCCQSSPGGGGGGSFVVNGGTPLAIAGGGGGCALYENAGPGLTGTSGGSGRGNNGGAGGSGGYGGGSGDNGGPGGGGYDGAGASTYAGGGGSFLGGGAGGYGYGGGGNGGYGGGGGSTWGGGGGGGGYSGGGGGAFAYGGGGGGSYIDASAVKVLTEVSGVASPDGSPNGEIIITAIPQSVTLNYHVADGKLVLDWAQGTLLLAGPVNGTYAPVNGASSPYTNTMTGVQQYLPRAGRQLTSPTVMRSGVQRPANYRHAADESQPFRSLPIPASVAAGPHRSRWSLAISRMRSIVAWLACMPLTCAVAGQPDTHYILTDTEKSPSRTFQIEYYENTNNATAQIWTAMKGRPANKSLLFELHGDPEAVTVLVSEDDKWLALNHRAGSDLRRPILFRKVSGWRFQKVKDINLESVAWSAAATNQGFSAKTAFDHSYSEAICWLGDSHSLVLRAWGYQSGEYGLDDWFCVYSVETKKTSFDLSVLNRRAFHSVGPDQKANQSVQRTGASRSAQRQIERHRRLAPVADLCVKR